MKVFISLCFVLAACPVTLAQRFVPYFSASPFVVGDKMSKRETIFDGYADQGISYDLGVHVFVPKANFAIVSEYSYMEFNVEDNDKPLFLLSDAFLADTREQQERRINDFFSIGSSGGIAGFDAISLGLSYKWSLARSFIVNTLRAGRLFVSKSTDVNFLDGWLDDVKIKEIV